MSQVKAGGVVTMRYVYNGKGEQVRKYTGTTNTYTVYDEAGHWLGDYDNAGNPIQQAVWMDDLPVGLMASNGVNYVEAEALGTPRAVIDPVRNVAIWKWDLTGEAFGNTAPNQNPDGDANSFVFNMRFPGQRYDAATGLNYNYFRDYDASAGRYSQSDPIGLNGGIGTYNYVGGSPLLASDPIGLECRTIYGAFFNVITCDPPFALNGSNGSSRGRYTPDEQSMLDKYCPGENKCSEIKNSINNLLSIAEGQIGAMRNDRSLRNLYELATSTPNPGATGTRTTWENHREKTRLLLDRISRMIELGRKIGCEMTVEYARYVMLQVPLTPD